MIGEVIDEPIDPSIATNYQVIEKNKRNVESMNADCGPNDFVMKYVLPIATAITLCIFVYRQNRQ